MDLKKEFGKYIRLCRKQAGMTQEQLAEKCGLSSRQISNIETGKSEPKFTSLTKICDSCGIEFEEVIMNDKAFFRPKLL